MSKAHSRLHLRHVLMIALGWTLLLLGLAALVLPGPGMLMTFGGVAILARYHTWARFLLRPVKLKALLGAAEGVETRLRVAASAVAGLAVGGFGVLWLLQPPAPAWWPVAEKWWLVGGRGLGVTLLLSCVVALLLLVFTVRRFHGKPEAVEELRMMVRARKRAEARIRELRRAR